MKNITVSVNNEVYHRVRVRAAERRSSVSALVREFLEHLAEEDSDFARKQRQQNELIARIRAERPGFSASDRLTRAEVHDRDALR